MIRTTGFSPKTSSLPCVFCIGSFDGVHKGHQHLLSIAKQIALSRSAQLAVLSFPIPPRALISNTSPSLITTPIHKRRLLESFGVDLLLEIPFTKELSLLRPEAFLALLEESLHIVCWVVGEDTCFGHRQAGNVLFLRDYAQRSQQEVHVIEKIDSSSCLGISSTRIRQAIRSGDLGTASSLLGRPYSILTTIQEGILCVDSLCLPPLGTWHVTVSTGTHEELTQLIISEKGCSLARQGKESRNDFLIQF